MFIVVNGQLSNLAILSHWLQAKDLMFSFNRMLADMEAELLAKAEASPNYRKLVIGLAEEAAERNVIWTKIPFRVLSLRVRMASFLFWYSADGLSLKQ